MKTDQKQQITTAKRCEKSSQDYVKIQNDAKIVIEGIVLKGLEDICSREDEKKEIAAKMTLDKQPLQLSGTTKKKRQPPDMMKGTITSLDGRISKLGKATPATVVANTNFFNITQTSTESTTIASERGNGHIQ